MDLTGWIDAVNELVSDSPWTYLLVFAAAGVDVLFPIVPGETTVIAAGVIAATGGLRLELVILAAALGAFAGDNLAYAIGRRLEGPARRRLFRGEAGVRSLRWAREALDDHGGPLLLVARFIPGGRTAVTVGAGTVGFRRRTFVAYDALACALWGTFAGLLGFLGGRAFQEQPWLGLLIGLGVSALLTLAVELWRRRRERRRVAAAGPGR